MNALAEPAERGLAAPSATAGTAQRTWAATPLRARLRCVRALRHGLAAHAAELGRRAAAVSGRPLAEKLVSEVLPLADACRWLEDHATEVLAARHGGRAGRPFWLQGATFVVHRQPHGVVLVIGPGNYPLFLPAVQILQALVAGNAVLLKPAPGTREVATAFADLAFAAGFDPQLLTVLPTEVAAARAAIAAGVDKVIFTGSSENGREVLAQLAASNTPAVMELSGADAVFVFADADLDLVVAALRFGTRLNAGETCIAPRRLFVADAVAPELRRRLAEAGVAAPPLRRFSGAEEARQLASTPMALGASIFSRDVAAAEALAAEFQTGFVTINDLIAPTADPRMPFGGVKASGFGTTRGAEGLLEMTFPHVVATRRGRARPHFDEPGADDAQLFTAYIGAAHGAGFGPRLASLRALWGALLRKARGPQTPTL